MADDLLRSVIELEKSLQRQLAEEQQRASAWLERERFGLRTRLEAERQRLDEAADARCRAAGERLVTRMRRREDRELARQVRFRQFAAVRLAEQLAKLLPGILPGEWHDHQDVEG